MITGIHHIAIIVSSEKSIDFYRKLGFTEIYRKERQYDTVVIMKCADLELELFVDPNHPPRAVNPENTGYRHIALKTDDFDEAVKQFNCDKVMTDWFGKRFVNIFDPDGIPIEIHE